jgi:hypothetical protein
MARSRVGDILDEPFLSPHPIGLWGLFQTGQSLRTQQKQRVRSDGPTGSDPKRVDMRWSIALLDASGRWPCASGKQSAL